MNQRISDILYNKLVIRTWLYFTETIFKIKIIFKSYNLTNYI